MQAELEITDSSVNEGFNNRTHKEIITSKLLYEGKENLKMGIRRTF